MTARYFYDTEFLEDGKTIELISIGIICEDGRQYYAVNAGITRGRLLRRIRKHEWLMANVVPHLPKAYGDWKNHMPRSWLFNYNANEVREKGVIATEVEAFLTGDVELWADYCAYDHVALAQLWGPMVDLPSNIPMHTNDIQTFAALDAVPVADLPQPTGSEHNALADARNVKARYEFLRDNAR